MYPSPKKPAKRPHRPTSSSASAPVPSPAGADAFLLAAQAASATSAPPDATPRFAEEEWDTATVYYADLLTTAAIVTGRARALHPDARYSAGIAPLHEKAARQHWWRGRLRRERLAFIAAWEWLEPPDQEALRRDGIFTEALDALPEHTKVTGPHGTTRILLRAVPCGWQEVAAPGGATISPDRLDRYLDARHRGWRPSPEHPLPDEASDSRIDAGGVAKRALVFGQSRAPAPPRSSKKRAPVAKLPKGK